MTRHLWLVPPADLEQAPSLCPEVEPPSRHPLAGDAGEGVSFLERYIRCWGAERAMWTNYDEEQAAREHEDTLAWRSFPDALLVDGVDRNYERRAYIRERNRLRQEAEARGQVVVVDGVDWAGIRDLELARIIRERE